MNGELDARGGRRSTTQTPILDVTPLSLKLLLQGVDDGMSLRRAARLYARHGWMIFPLQPRTKKPYKHTKGFYDASADSVEVARWWSQYPDSNIGLWPGPSGLVVFDEDGEAGHLSAKSLGLHDTATLTCVTGRYGGRHLYFKRPGFRIANLQLAPKLDVRADRGYVLLPPSIHPTGAVYGWREHQVASLPRRALEALRIEHSAPAGVRPRDVPLLSSIAEPGRHNSLLGAITRLVALTRGRMTAEEVFGWAEALNEARCSPGPIPASEVWNMVQWACGRENTPTTGKKPLAIRLGVPVATALGRVAIGASHD